jgi:hypothetical protein
MGWLYMPRSAMAPYTSAKAYLDAQFTYLRPQKDGTQNGLEVLASACPGNRVYYAACQAITAGRRAEIFAIVCLVRWNPRDKEGFVFGYKDMEDTMGPHEAECPLRILDMLSPTDNVHALEWRRRCRDSHALRNRPLHDGDHLVLPAPVTFTDGHTAQAFIVEKRGRAVVLRDPATHGRYRISGLMQRAWTVSPRTKVHPTLFG